MRKNVFLDKEGNEIKCTMNVNDRNYPKGSKEYFDGVAYIVTDYAYKTVAQPDVSEYITWKQCE